MMNHPNPWNKICHKVINQRKNKLPPAWIERDTPTNTLTEIGHHIHISGQKREIARRLIDLLDKARQKVVVSSFLLADKELQQALLKTAYRGIRIYVMLSSEARLGREEGDGEFDKCVLAEHKQMLIDLAGHVLFRSASHFHAKMLLIDPENHPAGLLLTANLTKEAFGRNEELAIELTPQEVREAAALAGWAMWETAEHEMIDPEDRFRSVKPLVSLQPPGPGETVLATTPERTELREQTLAIIDSAEKQLIVASFGWEQDHPVVLRLCERAREGVEITILARTRPASMPALLALREAGATVLGFKWLHAKAIWSDTNEALMMSANLQTDGLDRGFEIGVKLEGDRAMELQKRLTDWSNRARWRLEQAPRLGDINGKILLWKDSRLEEDEIETQVTIQLEGQIAKSADDLTAPPPTVNGTQSPLAHEIRYNWTIEAPKLHPKSKEIDQFRDSGSQNKRKEEENNSTATVYSLPIYKEPNGRLVVAIFYPEQLDAAKQLCREINADAIVVHEQVSQ